ncbi:MAG: prolyl oligopeptidase family serine peptidase [Myxococcaceae bacterium]
MGLSALSLSVLLACASSNEAVRDEAPTTSSMASAKVDARRAAGVPPFAQGNRAMKYPATKKDNLVELLHGTQVADPYRWLEEEKSPEVQAWMKSQDGLTREALAQMPGRDALTKRFKDLFYLDQIGVPVLRGDRLFYVRTHADKEKGILYWREGDAGAEKVLLDPNAWTQDGTVSLGVYTPSWDGKKLVFTRKPNAADEATLYVIDVDTGEESKVDVIAGAKYASPSWTPDNKSFYYEWLPTDPSIPVAERPGYTELRVHKLGTDPAKDTVVHPRTGDPKTFLSGWVSRDGKYLFSTIQRGWAENDVFLKRLGKDKEFKLLAKGNKTHFRVDVWKDQLYIMTDEGAPKERLYKVTAANAFDRKAWKEIIPEDTDSAVESFTIVGGHLALASLKNAVSQVKLYTLDGKLVRSVPVPGLGTATNLSGLEDKEEAYFAFSSFVFPREVYKTSLKQGETRVWAKVNIPVDPSRFTVDQVFYPSKDGTQVSMFIVHKKDLVRDGTTATLLYGYGGFNVPMTSAFSSKIYPWLEAGGIYAVANLRGGGEYGSQWHDAGMREHKQNVFDDYLAAAEYLVKEKYTSPKKLGIYGGSNGGLLVGAAVTQRPELFGAVVCAVPLLDMLRYQKFGSGMTWVPEYGNADVAGDFPFLYAYSPYHHVKAGTPYPPLLMMSADHDDRVDPLHARKFVAALQSVDGGPALLRIETNAGHGGADLVKQAIEQNADLYAFFFQTLGLSPAPAVSKPQTSR